MTLDELMATILQRLTNARTRAGMTQREVAETLQVATNTVSRWETGTYSLDMETFILLCALYNVSPALILAGEAQSPETRILELQGVIRDIQKIIDAVPAKQD